MAARRAPWLPWAALGLLAGIVGTAKIRSVDFFWHLASGRWMLEHGEILRFDPFRFTSDRAPWIDHEWLFQVALALVDAGGGVPLLAAARVAYAIGLGISIWFLVRRGGAAAWPAVGIAGLALVGIRARLLLRPELATFLGLALLLLVLERVRREGGVRWAVAAMGITVVWVNAHPGALIAPGVVALYLGGGAAEAWFRGEGAKARASALRGAWLTVGVGLALLANPFGAHVLFVPFAISGALTEVAGYNPDWLPSWRTVRPLFFAALAGMAIWVVTAVRRRVRVDLGLAAVTVAVAGLSLFQARQQPLFWIVGAALAGSLASHGVWSGGERRFGRAAGVVALSLAMLWIVRPSGPWAGRQPPLRLGFGIEEGLFPEHAVSRLETEWAEVGRLYHDLPFGGYLLWRLFPPRQVFWDTRNELEPELLLEMGRARQDGRLWFEAMERYEIDGALVGYDEDLRPEVAMTSEGPRVVGHHTTNALFFPRELFALVHWDDTAMLFVRRTEEREGRLTAVEYRHLHPEDWRATFERAEREPAFREEVEHELRRRVGEDPRSRRAERLLEMISSPPGAG